MVPTVAILGYEEGYNPKPYIDTENYPTIAGGIKIGPQGAALSNYTFTVPRNVGDLWQQGIVDNTQASMQKYPTIAAAMAKCNDARLAILISMAYQMGVSNSSQTKGLITFKNTLALIAAGNFTAAGDAMLNSKWAGQTPNRAKRHAQVMRDGTLAAYAGLI